MGPTIVFRWAVEFDTDTEFFRKCYYPIVPYLGNVLTYEEAEEALGLWKEGLKRYPRDRKKPKISPPKAYYTCMHNASVAVDLEVN